MIWYFVFFLGMAIGVGIQDWYDTKVRIPARDRNWRKALMQCGIELMKARGLDVREDRFCPDDRIYIVPKQ